jgi:hypothetical protein
MARRTAAKVVTALILATLVLPHARTVPPVLAAVVCTGNAVPADGRLYAYGAVPSVGAASDGIKGTISWANPNVCTIPGGGAFSLEAMTLCSNLTCDGWVQVGWRKDQGESVPSLLCEWHTSAGVNFISEAPITTAGHIYQMLYDPVDHVWDCYEDGIGKFARGSLGFASGTAIVGQGETNARYAQIGTILPAKLTYAVMKFHRSGSWLPMDVESFVVGECDINGNCIPDSHYGTDEGSGPGNFRNWTK